MTLSKSSPVAPNCVKGWILDVYPSELGKIAVWVITEKGQRIKFTDTFQPRIYVSAKQDDLERLISRLCNNQKIASLKFAQKYVQATDLEKSRVPEITALAENKRYERRVKAMQLIEKGVNPDAKKYLLLLYASTANLLSFSGYSTKKVYEAVKGEHQKPLQ